MKMKKIKYNLILALLLISSISCNDFLNPEIKSEVKLDDFGNTPSEVDFLLTNAYNEMRNNDFIGSIYWSLFTTDYSVPPAGTVLARSFISRMQYDASDGESFNIWTAQYRVIAAANLVIEKGESGLKKESKTASDEASYNRIIGEAKFIRALAYFNLVRLYRNVPIINNYFKNFAEIESVSNLPGEQMAEQEQKVYEFIIKDFTEASQILPSGITRGRANKFSAMAFLGKVYLNMASIEKFRDKKGDGNANYLNAIASLNAVINSGLYNLKPYFPDNFIRDKQYTGPNEFLFTLEFHELDKNGFNINSSNSGFIDNSGAGATVNTGAINSANGGSLATDHGWSVFDVNSPGDIVRRFWTFEDGEFRTYDANGNKINQNSANDCPNGQGPNCEIFLRSTEPYQFTRPYWFEVIDDANSFRSNPGVVDVITNTNNSTSFSLIWGGGNVNSNPGVKLVKYRRNPITQAIYTNATYDADYPVMRFSEVLLMYAEASNEIAGPTTKPADGKFTPLEAVNLIRNRARNFAYYGDLTTNKRIIENSPFTATYGDVFSRVAKVGKNPAKTANAADTLKKYYNQISAFKGLREVPATPNIRNFKEFEETKDFVPDFPASLNADEFRNELFDERWRELAGEQNNRWYDLVRTGKLIENIQDAQQRVNILTKRSLQTTPFGQQVLQTPNEKYNYLAIPQSEISRNPNLKQNPGY
jgi:hypothetical protein